MTTLIEQARKVAELRHRKATYDAEFDAAIAKFEADNMDITMKRRAAIDDLVAAEKELRDAGLAAYKATGEKHPAPGLGIRENHKAIYDKDEAEAWAWNHKLALHFDPKAFEKIAEAQKAQVPFVNWEVVPTATIATDLDKALEGVDFSAPGLYNARRHEFTAPRPLSDEARKMLG